MFNHNHSLEIAKKKYTGIGARDTPLSMKQDINVIAEFLAISGMTLVSGGAVGADSFFEEGCDKEEGRKEIWLPEIGFNNHSSQLLPSDDAFILAPRFVPQWKNCNSFARNAHARNCHQILGADLMSPVRFVVCWTFNGDIVGGTGTALRIAQEYDVPVLNLGNSPSVDDIDEFFQRWIE